MTTYNESTPYMKSAFCTIICLTTLGLTLALAQEPSPPPPVMPPRPMAPSPAPPPGGQFSERLQSIIQRAGAPPSAEPSLTKFSLDFPGGTPRELVAAIEKATGRPLNAIIPDELAATRLPALKMNSVDVSQLFQALAAASRKSEAQILGPSNISFVDTSYGFRQGSEGRATDDTIWYFRVEKPVQVPFSVSGKVCRFYSLRPYVDRGLSVDDITTAIETGWKMLGETSPPTISFHKDTKLLIAVGEESKLETIDAALKALEPPMTGRIGGRFGGPGVGGPGVGGGGFAGGGFQPTTPSTNAPAPAAKKATRPEAGP